MAFRYEMTGPGVEQIVRTETPGTLPGAGEVQLRVRASSINYHDVVTLIGLIPGMRYPRVPLSDGCGEIVAVGEGVTDFNVGERVITVFYPLWQSGRPTAQSKQLILGENTDGCLQEFLTIDAGSVVRAPHNLDDEEAATLVCAGHTAWYALMEEYQLQAGQTVLVQGTGGVSLFALQLARSVGARVVATSSSDAKLAKMKAHGADYLVNYKTHPDWEQQVMQCTGPVDAVVDVGGEATLGKSIACTKTDGFIAVIGILSGFGAAPVSVIEIMQKNLTVKGVTVGCRDSLNRMCRHIEQHGLKPVISHRLAASELALGLQLMERGDHFGKIAVSVD